MRRTDIFGFWSREIKLCGPFIIEHDFLLALNFDMYVHACMPGQNTIMENVKHYIVECRKFKVVNNPIPIAQNNNNNYQENN